MAGERLGTEHDDLDIEIRLRRIEQLLSGSSAIVAGVDDVDVSGSVPVVSGLALDAGAKNITVSWEDPNVPVTEFDFFEVQFATDSAFSANVFTDNTKSTKYTFIDGDPNTTYYARVRVLLNDGRTGSYTSALNTSTGLVVTNDIDSVTEPASAFTRGDLVVASGGTATAQSVTLTTINKPVFISVSCDFVTARDSVTRIKRGSTVLVETDTVANFAFSFNYIDQTPGSGSVTYSLEWEDQSGAGNTISERSIIVFETRVV